ncbi:uncharacterized protein LOC134764897 [Penaeus indicus]|uniref:uncharacterized protein LOC134764897 n=1 Tax=Penaeus indicus TaxID=29960 RepID=UPI00300CFCB1
MASLRDHVELKEQPSFVDISLNERGPPTPSPSPLSITWRKGTVVAAVCAVAVVATVATLAVFAQGGGAVAKTEHPHPHVSSDRQMIGDAAGLMRGSTVFKQLLSGLLTATKENEAGQQASQKTAEVGQDIAEPEFKEEQVKLENDEAYEGGSRPYPPSRVQASFVPPPDDPNFKQEVVQLENPTEHDQPRAGEKKEAKEEERKREQRDTASKVETGEGEEESHEKKVEEPAEKVEKVEEKVEEPAEKVEEPAEKVEKVEEKVEEPAEKVEKVEEKVEKPAEKETHAEKVEKPATELQSPHNKEFVVCETPECAVAASQISESLDLSTNPCDNFYQFACGGWMDKHPIPDSGATGTFYEAGDVLTKRLKLILESPVSPSEAEPLHMVNRFYEACMDTDTMDSLGLQPLITSLNNQGGWPMVTDGWDSAGFNLASALVNLRDINVYPIFGVGIDANLFNVSGRVIYVRRNGGLPSLLLDVSLRIAMAQSESRPRFVKDNKKIDNLYLISMLLSSVSKACSSHLDEPKKQNSPEDDIEIPALASDAWKLVGKTA